jgi:hypothetical protein
MMMFTSGINNRRQNHGEYPVLRRILAAGASRIRTKMMPTTNEAPPDLAAAARTFMFDCLLAGGTRGARARRLTIRLLRRA